MKKGKSLNRKAKIADKKNSPHSHETYEHLAYWYCCKILVKPLQQIMDVLCLYYRRKRYRWSNLTQVLTYFVERLRLYANDSRGLSVNCLVAVLTRQPKLVTLRWLPLRIYKAVESRSSLELRNFTQWLGELWQLSRGLLIWRKIFEHCCISPYMKYDCLVASIQHRWCTAQNKVSNHHPKHYRCKT